jgi:hypothetical protein
MKRLTIVPLVVLGFTSFTSATAQEQPPLEPGQRVRVTAPDLAIHNQAGRFEAVRGDSLVLAGAVSTMTFPVASITRLEVSRARKSHTLIGAGIGFVVGALAGAAVGPSAITGDISKGGARLFGAGIGALGGTVLGLAVGAISKSDRWEEVPLDRLRVSFAPQADGRFALMVSLAF